MRVTLALALRLAWRTVLADCRQSSAVVATMALATCGLASTAAVVDALWLRPLPFEDSERIAVVFTLPPNAADIDRNPLRSLDFVELRERLADTAELSGISTRERAVRIQKEPIALRVSQVSANFWTVLRTGVDRGRIFTATEDENQSRVAVISDAMWRSHFGSAPDTLGRTISIDAEPHVIIGIAAGGFDVPFSPSDVWVPLGVSRRQMPAPTATYIIGIARMAGDLSLRLANERVAIAMEQLGQSLPATHRGWRAGALAAREFQFGDQRRVVLVLFAGALLLFLIAFLNIVNTSLMSVISRSDDLRTAAALGARVRDFALQQLGTTLILLAIGGVAGVALAFGVLMLLSALDADWNRQFGMPAIGWPAYTATLVSIVITTCGAATLAIRKGMRQVLHGAGNRVVGHRRDRRLARALSTIQVAVVLVLMAAAITLALTFYRSTQAEPGFETTGVVAMQLRMPSSLYPSRPARAQAVDAFLERVRALPSVTVAAATTNAFQPGQAIATLIHVDGRPSPDGSPHITQVRYISGDYFQAMGIPIPMGRPIQTRDLESAPASAVVSRLLARQLWGTEDVIGRRLSRHAGDMPPFTVVGIAEDVSDIRIGQPPVGVLYLSYAQINFEAAPVALLVRTAMPFDGLARSLRQAVLSIAPDQPIYRIAPLSNFVVSSFSPQRFRTGVLGMIAVQGLLLAALGIYAVVGRSILERLRELAIRRALGAGTSHLCRVALSDAGFAVSAGSLIGLPAAIALLSNSARVIPGLQAPNIPASLGALSIVGLTIFVTAATLLPRVFRVDAASALRGDG